MELNLGHGRLPLTFVAGKSCEQLQLLMGLRELDRVLGCQRRFPVLRSYAAYTEITRDNLMQALPKQAVEFGEIATTDDGISVRYAGCAVIGEGTLQKSLVLLCFTAQKQPNRFTIVEWNEEIFVLPLGAQPNSKNQYPYVCVSGTAYPNIRDVAALMGIPL